MASNQTSTLVEPLDDGYMLYRAGVGRIFVFPARGGWVSTMRSNGIWRRWKPQPTPEAAAFARWGQEAADAVKLVKHIFDCAPGRDGTLAVAAGQKPKPLE